MSHSKPYVSVGSHYGGFYSGESFLEICTHDCHDIYFYFSNRSKTLLGISIQERWGKSKIIVIIIMMIMIIITIMMISK